MLNLFLLQNSMLVLWGWGENSVGKPLCLLWYNDANVNLRDGLNDKWVFHFLSIELVVSAQ